MQFKSHLTLLTLLISQINPCHSHTNPSHHHCLDDTLSTTLADSFAHLISNWTSNSTSSTHLANQIISPTFLDYSESITMLVSHGTATGPQPLYTNREEWKKGQLTVPPLPYERLNLWRNCEEIIVRWRTQQKVFNVTGLYVLRTVVAPRGMETPYERVIDRVWSEFNSAAWLISIGWKGGNCTDGH